MSLLIIASAQLMLVLDDSIANIALPSIQRDLDVSTAALPWVITSYVLAFGGLLLLGGRAGDLLGRLKVFRLGVAIFTAASLINGLAAGEAMLLASRAVQGVGAALAAPNALALIAANFPAGEDRNKAMAVYGAMSGLGITGGVLLGGLLTELSWRWIFLINVPIGIAVLVGSRTLADGERHAGRLDVLGAITGTAGVLALAYAITRGGERGWTDATTLGLFVAALALLAGFVALQRRSAHPVLPLRLLADRTRSGSYLAMLFVGAGLMGTGFLVVLFVQQVLGLSAIQAGLAFLPFSAGIILSQGVSPRLVERLAPRFVAAPGLLLAAGGLAWLSLLDAGSSYFGHIAPAVLLAAFGLGLAFVPLTLGVMHGVPDDETGVASALFNTAQQIGAALGVAVFGSIAAAAAKRAPGSAVDALADGYATAMLAVAAMLVLAASATFVTVTRSIPEQA